MNYVYNTDMSESRHRLGDHKTWNEDYLSYLPDYMSGQDIPSLVMDTEYGHVFIVYEPIFTQDGTFVGYVSADFSMADVRSDYRGFLYGLIALAFASTCLIAIGCILYTRINLVKPLNAMASAANTYLAGDKSCSFASLSVNTHDELQSLAESLKAMSDKTDRYVQDLHEANARAERDVLTGLYNRGALDRRASETLAHPYDGQAMHALLMIDLDKFKQVNDTYGHIKGDEVLSTLASLFRSVFRSNDVIARIGGDEFCIFCPNIGTADVVRQKAESMVERWRNTQFTHNDETFSATLSVGIALAPRDGTTVSELYLNADAALYISKERGRDQYTLYDASFAGVAPTP